MAIYQGAASKRIFTVTDKPIEIKNDVLPDLKVSKCQIEFNNVDFKYETTNDKAVKNITMQIEGGKVTALVGQSGAGKSTIINLIPRFYDPQNGSINIDGQNIRTINLKSLRKHLALVSQDIVLFDDTIKNNISYANPSASDQEIKSACNLCG